ncbi:hypothetical protein Runsl_5199 [Runella slithyformis DSM 19594]|uniref:Secretion system C-terminal sorting domain-containing protein n=1 Tax=Runella slithyformis (strain ATCC 29530 / DSM 19594 / LMG 11500 / NCIMB 11436 / LSU 4) TaxID=761193 RepID=A0A7U3ZQH8_RUNSL|nr:hypothetical protein Runsl_5199 [Runella slithyformis DSM 19594]
MVFSLIQFWSYTSQAGYYYYNGNPSASFNFNSQNCRNTFTISNVEIRINNRSEAYIKIIGSLNVSIGNGSVTYESYGSISGGNVNFATTNSSTGYHWCTSDIASNRTFWRASISNLNFTGGQNISCTLTVSTVGLAPASSDPKNILLSFIDSGSPSFVQSTSGITGTSVCAGTTLSLTIRGSAPTRAVVVANVGGVQTQIGTVTSDNDFDTWGTINWTVPAGIASGTQIFFRVNALSVTQSSAFSAFSPVSPNLIISETSLCSAKQIALQVTGISGNLFVDGNNGWPSNSTTYNPTPQSSTTYTVTVQRRGNGSDRVCSPVTVSQSVQVFTFNPSIATASQTKCLGEAISVRAEPNGNGSFDYTWTRDGQGAGNGQQIEAREPGNYSVSIKPTGAAASCPAKSAGPVRFNFDTPIPDQNITFPKERPIICGAPDPTTLTLTAQPGQSGINYQWQREGGGFNANGQSVTVSQSGKYIVNMNRGACSRQKSIEVQDNNYDPNIASAPDAFCSDAPITLTANANDPGRFDYAWKREGTGFGGNSPTLTLPNELGTFRYKVEITSKGTGCSTKTSAEIVIRADRAITGHKIILPAGKMRAVICGAPEEPAIDLSAAADAPLEGITYQWQGPAVTGTAAVGKVSREGDYRVIFRRGACSKESTVKVESGFFVPNISSTGTIINSPTDIRICSGESSIISASLDGTGIPNNTANFTYQWFGGVEGNTELTTQKDNTLRVSTPGLYRLEVALTGSGCAVRKTAQKIKITVDPAFKNARITPNPAIICNKATGLEIAVLSDSSAGATYRWSGGGKSNSDPSKYVVDNAGTYTAFLSRGACFAQANVSPREEELKVTVTPPNQSNPIIVCSGANGIPMVLQAVSNLSSAVITWKRDDSDAPGSNTGTGYTPTQTGRYFATANFNNICTATSPQRIAVEALSNFSVNITPNNPPALCDDRPIPLTATVSDTRYTALYNYEWIQDTRSVKTGIGANTLSTGKVVNYTGNTLVLGNESNYTLSIVKDGCKATSSVSKITLKPARSGIIVLDYNTLQATESSDGTYQWYYKPGNAASLADSAGYTLEAGVTGRMLLGAKPGSYMVRANRNGCGTKYSFAYSVAVATAIDPLLNDEWKVYPNPTTEAITVENRAGSAIPATLDIWNANGQKLRSHRQLNARESYPLTDLPMGTYYLEIRQNGQKVTKKIIKE